MKNLKIITIWFWLSTCTTTPPPPKFDNHGGTNFMRVTPSAYSINPKYRITKDTVGFFFEIPVVILNISDTTKK